LRQQEQPRPPLQVRRGHREPESQQPAPHLLVPSPLARHRLQVLPRPAHPRHVLDPRGGWA